VASCLKVLTHTLSHLCFPAALRAPGLGQACLGEGEASWPISQRILAMIYLSNHQCSFIWRKSYKTLPNHQVPSFLLLWVVSPSQSPDFHCLLIRICLGLSP
jgi:hypothetical protein